MRVFDLIVWAVISIILLLIVISLFNNIEAENDLKTELENGLKLAETDELLGKLVKLNARKVESDYLLSKTNFDLVNRSIAIECTNPDICCPMSEECEKIEWDQTMAIFKSEKEYDFFVRCVFDRISVCKIYFGKEPAQAKIDDINLISKQGTSSIIQLIVSNNGKVNLIEGNSTIELFKKVKNNWEKTSEVFPHQTISLLQPNQKHIFVWNVETKTIGEYQLKTIFQGNNAGFDSKTIDFNIDLSLNCETNESKTKTIYDNVTEKYRQIHYCENCNFSYECVAVWNEKKPNTQWNIIDKDKIFCEKQTASDSC